MITALVAALANSGISSLRQEMNDDFANHEKRIDRLENIVFGNDIGNAPREQSLTSRIAELERTLSSSVANSTDEQKPQSP